MTGRRIAVVGGGVSGITAGYVLSRTDRVTLFEADDRLGGHADTHPTGVDTGFIVYNERTYPLLTRLFAGLPGRRGRYVRMLAEVPRFHRAARRLFPGGPLPSVTAIQDSLARTTLRITGREDFGDGYAETLRIWRERFGAQAGEVARLGFDEVFNRMWTFYLCYSEAGFRAGYIDVSQLTLARP